MNTRTGITYPQASPRATLADQPTDPRKSTAFGSFVCGTVLGWLLATVLFIPWAKWHIEWIRLDCSHVPARCVDYYP